MQIPPTGPPSGPLPPARNAPSRPTGGDHVELGKSPPQPHLITPRALPPRAPEPPRPQPRPPATAALGAPAPLLLPGPLAAALLEKPRGEWEARPTPEGWKVPKNPSRTPVRPRDLLDIPENDEPLTIVSNLTGRLRALRLQWPEEFQEPAYSAQLAVLHDLLTRLPPDISMHVVTEGLATTALPAILREWTFPNPERVHIHPLHIRSTAELNYEPMTMWARDGALLARTREGREVLLLPRSFRGDGRVDAALNRLVVQGTGVAPALLASEVLVRRSRLSFEGGDVVASDRTILLGGQSLAATMAELKVSRGAALELFEQELGRPVVVIEPQPDFHVDLGFTFLDEQTIAVADPAETMKMVAALAELQPLVEITRDKRLAEGYAVAARRLQERGFSVVRLPNLGGRGLLTPYLTYNNVLLENHDQVKRVYLPVYDVPLLDEAARSVYRQHGYQVVDMPSARLSTKLWGAIRCATGELSTA